jgi:hypothetical protein
MTGVTQSQPITTDIVERIRNLCTHDDGPEPAERLLDEAADEIEALRHDLDRHMQIAAEALTASANGEASGVAYTVPDCDHLWGGDGGRGSGSAAVITCEKCGVTRKASDSPAWSSRLHYGPLNHFGPEDNDPGTAFIIHNVDDTVTIKVRSPGDRVFSEVEMPLDAWIKLRSVGGPDTSSLPSTDRGADVI